MKKLIIVLILLTLANVVDAEIIDDHTENNCNNGICTASIYQAPVFIETREGWREVDLNFKAEGCRESFDFCSNESLTYHQPNLKDFFDDTTIIGNNKNFSLVFTGGNFGNNVFDTLNTALLNYTSIEGNKITYHFNDEWGIDYVVENLMSGTKDTIVLNKFIRVNRDIKLFFDVDTNYRTDGTREPNGVLIGSMIILDKNLNEIENIPLIFDSHGNGRDKLSIEIPKEIFNDESLYPLYFDPIITFTDAQQDIFLLLSGLSVTRNNVAFVEVGSNNACPSLPFNALRRGLWEFNVSVVPKENRNNITNISLKLTPILIENPNYRNQTVRVVRNSSLAHYPDTTGGNIQIALDIANDTVLAQPNISLSNLNQNLLFELNITAPFFSYQLNQTIGIPETTLDLGIRSIVEPNECGRGVRYASLEQANTSRFPQIIIEYQIPTVKGYHSSRFLQKETPIGLFYELGKKNILKPKGIMSRFLNKFMGLIGK
ncbi:MAG: hypothetical protein Q8P57_03860 [Candidatus Pacearchaeota archaeon]|nr:hypothetical protein [Candidatus Pacearchaeota archaeon]